jgi:hypothetical protein
MIELPEKQQDFFGRNRIDRQSFVAEGLAIALVDHIRNWASGEPNPPRRAALGKAASDIGDIMRNLKEPPVLFDP